MKRILTSILLASILLSFGISASARWNDNYRCSPSLSFSGNTATCSAIIDANSSNSKISAAIALYRVNSNGTLSTCASWPSKTGTGSLSLSGRYPSAQSGSTYRLVVTGTVKDNTGSHSISTYRQAKCP